MNPDEATEPSSQPPDPSSHRDAFVREMAGVGFFLVLWAGVWRISGLTADYLEKQELLMPVIGVLWLIDRYRNREPSPPPTAFAGVVTVLIIMLVGVSIMIRNATGRDPLDHWGAPLWAVLWGFWATHGKARHRLPHAYVPAIGALLTTAAVLPSPPGLQFEVASVAMGLLLIFDARTVGSRRRRGTRDPVDGMH
jgi:hypothetical protein